MSSIFNSYDNPIISLEELKNLPIEKLSTVADELRKQTIALVNKKGGHFAANLGVIELTIALHYVIDPPKDILIWDVGHQSYPHKLLTDRFHQAMSTLKDYRGIAPFPLITESSFDAFGTGHSSTALSAALGFAEGSVPTQKRNIVCVVGDGAMTAGIFFEALGHWSEAQYPILMILNDNEMSISKNVGGYSQLLKKKPTEISLFFRSLNLNYEGIIDGHDLQVLTAKIKKATQSKKPCILHVKTVKGYGFKLAEHSPIAYHAMSPGFLERAENEKKDAGKTFSQIFGSWCSLQASSIPSFRVITPAMIEGSGLKECSIEHRQAVIDVAIAEQHALTYAAGIAAGGEKSVVTIYSTFLQRALDQLIHDIALQRLRVLITVDRAGLVPDGPTHHGIFDLPLTLCIPNLVVTAPATAEDLIDLLDTYHTLEAPTLIRYPKDLAPTFPKSIKHQSIQKQKAQILVRGSKIAILFFGPIGLQLLDYCCLNKLTLVNMRYIKPLDLVFLKKLSEKHQMVITLEEGALIGGAGHYVAEKLKKVGFKGIIHHLGIDEFFPEWGNKEDLLRSVKLDQRTLESQIDSFQSELRTKEAASTCYPDNF